MYVFASTGRFSSIDALRAFIDKTYTKDGEGIPSDFIREVGLTAYEPTCIEAIHAKKPQGLKSLLKKASYAEQWLPQLPTDEEADAAICVYEPNRVRSPRKSSLTFVGLFDYRPRRESTKPASMKAASKKAKSKKSAKKRPAGKKASKGSSVQLYASAPGLMIHSPDAVSEFIAGEAYTDDLGSRRTPAGRLVGEARIVMLNTGSPGLDYVLSFELGEPPSEVTSEAIDTTEFHLVVRGDTLVMRDGYQAEFWGDADYAKVDVPIPSGLYRVVATYVPHEKHSHMRIHFFLSPAKKKLAKPQGWIDLDYVA